jgi:chorismate mutase
MKSLRAFRGATQLTADSSAEMRGAVMELVGQILEENRIEDEDLISILLTATPDLRCEFPAVGVRLFGITDVPLICAQEIDAEGSLPLTVRILIHAQSDLSRVQIKHQYLRGAKVLRPDLDSGESSGPRAADL